MMITELIDQDDYRDWLMQAGVPVLAESDSPIQCSEAALRWLETQDDGIRAQFKVAVAEFNEKRPIMLPAVQEALCLLDNA
ncbi:hypothetical protein Q4508_17585 [Amphritea sp. 2_MG-2023]|jgi:hypothetical protein|uniref:hypothetical protein n=1 Tax=Amphritea TaxID=515417 RepID=UPI001C07102E|nr:MULTISPECIES: hypothetical protein [Amphritea]MBU2967005.1 hypothetical protein [Amphritea atlantica]MDO6420371.1 hypothetical protein [Amphritea sp. 2_MG-2023]MDX2423274.1 hypothetical protein [Amphritea sp.]